MSRAPARVLALLIGFLAVVPPTVSAGGEVPISLDAAVRTAIENNLGLRVETYNPAIAETGILRAGAIYNPKLTALVDHRGENLRLAPDTSLLERDRYFDADVSLDQLLATGATASLSSQTLWSRQSLGSDAPRTVEPELSLSLSQPLLSGRGREVTERDITVASYAKDSALAAWRTAALTVAANTRDAYFALVAAREDLATREASLALARRIHAENQARVRAGVLASIELLDSEFGVASRERDVIEARNAVRQQADKLRVVIHYPGSGTLSAATAVSEERVEASAKREIATALRLRPDLRAARLSLRSLTFQAKVARNLALPSLSVTGTAGLRGLGTGYGDAASDLAKAETPFWSIGLGLSYPIGNDAARADEAEARLKARQAEAQIRSLTESIGLDVRSAIRDMDTEYQAIDAAKKGVTLGKARLDSFLKRGKLGLATTKNILEVEADYVAAQNALTSARVAYQGAITRLYRSTGELLEKQGIRIDDRAVEAMARKELQ